MTRVQPGVQELSGCPGRQRAEAKKQFVIMVGEYNVLMEGLNFCPKFFFAAINIFK